MLRSAETLFLGSHTNRIDAKGRIAAPADFRRALDLKSFNGFFCVPNLLEPHLDCGGADFIQSLRTMIAALDPYDPDRGDLQEALIGEARTIMFDADGRFILPHPLRDFAKLDGEARFVGMGDTFQIRCADGAEARRTGVAERARKALTKLKNPINAPGLPEGAR